MDPSYPVTAFNENYDGRKEQTDIAASSTKDMASNIYTNAIKVMVFHDKRIRLFSTAFFSKSTLYDAFQYNFGES